MTVRTIDDIFRDFVIPGVPSSGLFNPHKPDIRDTLKALLEGISAFPDNRVIRLNNANEGSPNNIIVTASVSIPTAAYQVLYILNVTQENTGPVTVSGAVNRTLVTNTSRPIEPAYLQPGMGLLCVDTGTELRLLSYGDAEAIQEAAEDAAARAEAAANSLNLPTIQPGDAGKSLVVNPDENGYELGSPSSGAGEYESRAKVEETDIPETANFLRTAGYYAPGDGGGALYKRVATQPAHAGKIQSADGAWWELADDVINIKALGAKADSTGVGNGTDSSAFLSNAILCAIALKKNVYVPSGKYRLAAQVTYDKTALNADNVAVPNIMGDGITMTRFHCDGSGVRLAGSLTAGFYVSWIEISDIQFIGNNRAANTIGIDVENQGFLRFKRVKCSNFDKGVRLKGVISSKLEQPFLSYNNIGLHALPDDGDAWPPNALTIDQPWVGSNTRAGIILDKPATFNIRGGSVEGNGTNTAIGINQRAGIIINNPGLGGHAAIVSDGVYYEYNSGAADVLFFGTSREVASAFSGNTFTRMGSNPASNCIAVFGVSHKFSLSLDGNGFGELGSGITPPGPYLNIETNSLIRISERGNTYQNVAYAPSFANVMADCEQTRPVAMGYVSAAGTIAGPAVNVASVAKVATGQYKITLASPVAGRKYALTSPGSARQTYTLTFDATSVTVGFANQSGVDTDTEFGFCVYATALR